MVYAGKHVRLSVASEGVHLQEASAEASAPAPAASELLEEPQEAAKKLQKRLSRPGSSGRGSRKLAKVKKVGAAMTQFVDWIEGRQAGYRQYRPSPDFGLTAIPVHSFASLYIC